MSVKNKKQQPLSTVTVKDNGTNNPTVDFNITKAKPVEKQDVNPVVNTLDAEEPETYSNNVVNKAQEAIETAAHNGKVSNRAWRGVKSGTRADRRSVNKGADPTVVTVNTADYNKPAETTQTAEQPAAQPVAQAGTQPAGQAVTQATEGAATEEPKTERQKLIDRLNAKKQQRAEERAKKKAEKEAAAKAQQEAIDADQMGDDEEYDENGVEEGEIDTKPQPGDEEDIDAADEGEAEGTEPDNEFHVVGRKEARQQVRDERVNNALRDFAWYTEFNSYGKEFNATQLQNSMQPQDIRAFQKSIGLPVTGIIDRTTYANLKAMYESNPEYRDMFKKEAEPVMPGDNEPAPQPDENSTKLAKDLYEDNVPQEILDWIKRNRSDVPKGFKPGAVRELQGIMKKYRAHKYTPENGYTDETREVYTKEDDIWGHQTMTDFADLLVDLPGMTEALSKLGVSFDSDAGFKLNRDYKTLKERIDSDYNKKYNEYVRNWNNRNQERNQKFQRFADVVNLVQGAGAASGGVKPKDYNPSDKYADIEKAMKTNFDWYDTKETTREKNLQELMKQEADNAVADKIAEQNVRDKEQDQQEVKREANMTNDIRTQQIENEKAKLAEEIRNHKASESIARQNAETARINAETNRTYYTAAADAVSQGGTGTGTGTGTRTRRIPGLKTDIPYDNQTIKQKMDTQALLAKALTEVSSEEFESMCEQVGLTADKFYNMREQPYTTSDGKNIRVNIEQLVKAHPELAIGGKVKIDKEEIDIKTKADQAYIISLIMSKMDSDFLKEGGYITDSNIESGSDDSAGTESDESSDDETPGRTPEGKIKIKVY